MPRRRGYWILAFLDKDLDHIGEEAIGFYGFSSLVFPFPEEAVRYLSLFDLSRRGGCWIFASFPDRGVTYM